MFVAAGRPMLPVLLVVEQAFWICAAIILAAIAHMVIVKARVMEALNTPLDGGRMFRQKRVFGDNKTWRGVVVMIVASAMIGALQGFCFGHWAHQSEVALLDFAALARRVTTCSGAIGYSIGYGLVAGLLGLGYALGELPNSFVKRRLGIGPGQKAGGLVGVLFVLIDQVDSVAFGLLLLALVQPLTWRFVVAALLALPLMHLLLAALLRVARIKKEL
jgi:CDP-diglyceride synthetase